MGTIVMHFNDIVEKIYGLTLEDKIELKNILEHNISDARRNEIASNFKRSLTEFKSGKLKFSSKLVELKKML
jgi:hypothetical protein